MNAGDDSDRTGSGSRRQGRDRHRRRRRHLPRHLRSPSPRPAPKSPACDINLEERRGNRAGCASGRARRHRLRRLVRVATPRRRSSARRKPSARLDILVNGAAMSDPTATVLELDLAAWNKVFATNLGGAFLMSRWTIPHMIAPAAAPSSTSPPSSAPSARRGRVALLLHQGRPHHHGQGHGRRPRRSEHPRQHPLARRGRDRPACCRFGSMEKAREVLGSKHLMKRLGHPQEIAAGRALPRLATPRAS